MGFLNHDNFYKPALSECFSEHYCFCCENCIPEENTHIDTYLLFQEKKVFPKLSL